VAAAGEENRVVIHWEADGVSVTLSDAGATIGGPPELCAPIDAHSVRCHTRPTDPWTGLSSYLLRVTANLGDANDQLRFTGLPAHTTRTAIYAGEGNDEVLGSRDRPAGWSTYYGPFEEERFNGGPSDDHLVGSFGADILDGGGHDVLAGLEGDDILKDGDLDGAADALGPSRDVLEGGSGFDTASYERRTRPVRVDLAHVSGNGAHGEGDVLAASRPPLVGGPAIDSRVQRPRRGARTAASARCSTAGPDRIA
jgi:Ca2+-binding RTX toxin-like protein